MEYLKLCPICNEKQFYSTKYVLKNAINNNCLCKRCSGEKQRIKVNYIFLLNENWCKKCTGCGNNMIYSSRNSAMKYKNVRCNSCAKKGTKRSEVVKRKLSIQKIGKNNPMFGKSSHMKGKHHTEETKYKLRIATIKNMRDKGLLPSQKNYNPIACHYIDKLNIEHKWNLQHALNGGEIELCGYFVDGYDRNKNIIFEYDEPKHNSLSVRKRDEIRQKRIIEITQPKMFIRYNERFNKLYDVISGKELI